MHFKQLLVIVAVCLTISGLAMSESGDFYIAESSNASNFNGTPISGGSYIWFNASFNAAGIPSTGATVYLTSSSVSFTADQPYTVAVPDAQIVFDPSAICAATTFDSFTNTWNTTVPVSGSDENFLSGLTFAVPASFADADGRVRGPVTWQGTFGTDNGQITFSWKWSAAVYKSYTTDYNLLGVKPTHTRSCLYSNSDHAGTPEGIHPLTGLSFKQSVTGGARGGGGSNWTGSWSSTTTIIPTLATIPN